MDWAHMKLDNRTMPCYYLSINSGSENERMWQHIPFLLIAALVGHFIDAYTYLCINICLAVNRQAGPNDTRYTDRFYVVADR
jgi:hypothetical protein